MKFLKDPEVSPEIKDTCFKLLENPIIEYLVKKASVRTIFEVCEEYIKHTDWYDEIFNGKIKIFLKGLMNEALPIYNYLGIHNDYNLKMYLGPNTLIGEIVDKFVDCNALTNKINRITMKIKNNKVLTAGFDSKNEVKVMVIDFIDILEEEGPLLKLLNLTPHKRIDLIRI
jgi:hypothetical protein